MSKVSHIVSPPKPKAEKKPKPAAAVEKSANAVKGDGKIEDKGASDAPEVEGKPDTPVSNAATAMAHALARAFNKKK